MSDLDTALSKLTINQISYILGFNPQLDTRDAADMIRLRQAMRGVLTDNIDIVDHVTKINQHKLDIFLLNTRLIHGRNAAVINTEDTHYIAVNTYPPWDVVRYCDDNGKIFQFTRAEFSFILSTSNNPHTRSELPRYLMDKVTVMNNLATRYRLPVSDGIDNIINNIRNTNGLTSTSTLTTTTTTARGTSEQERGPVGEPTVLPRGVY